MMTARDLELAYPSIEWREPISVTVSGGVTRWCCRYCIALDGLKAHEVGDQFISTDAVREHIRQKHMA